MTVVAARHGAGKLASIAILAACGAGCRVAYIICQLNGKLCTAGLELTHRCASVQEGKCHVVLVGGAGHCAVLHWPVAPVISVQALDRVRDGFRRRLIPGTQGPGQLLALQASADLAGKRAFLCADAVQALSVTRADCVYCTAPVQPLYDNCIEVVHALLRVPDELAAIGVVL